MDFNGLMIEFGTALVTKIERKRLGDLQLPNVVKEKAGIADDLGLEVLEIEAIMAHATTPNYNRAEFRDEDFQALGGKLFTPPTIGIIDWEHDLQPIGAWYSSEYVSEHEGYPALRVKGAIWAWRFPDQADAVLGRYAKGKLYVSMMCIPEAYHCKVCGKTYPFGTPISEMCEHLQSSICDFKSPYTRVLVKPIFLATSIVKDPADTDAEGQRLNNVQLAIAERMRLYAKYAQYAGIEIPSNKKTQEGGETDMDKEFLDDQGGKRSLKVLRGNKSYLLGLPINKGKWSFTGSDKDAIIDKGGMALFKKVHLAMDSDGDPENKTSYHFPVAKLVDGKMHIFYNGVKAAKQRASQFGYSEVEKFADSIFQALKEKIEKEDKAMDELKQKIKELEKEKAELQKIIETKDKQIAELKDTANKLVEEVKDFKAKSIAKEWGVDEDETVVAFIKKHIDDADDLEVLKKLVNAKKEGDKDPDSGNETNNTSEDDPETAKKRQAKEKGSKVISDLSKGTNTDNPFARIDSAIENLRSVVKEIKENAF